MTGRRRRRRTPEVAEREIIAAAEELLRERRRVKEGDPDDFTVRNMQEIADAMSSITASMTGLLGGIAAAILWVMLAPGF